MMIIETSAKTGDNANEIHQNIIDKKYNLDNEAWEKRFGSKKIEVDDIFSSYINRKKSFCF